MTNSIGRRFFIFGLPFFSLAAFFFVFWVAWSYYLQPRMVKLSDDFSYHAQVNSKDNFYSPTSKRYLGELRSISQISFQANQSIGNTLIIQNSFDVRHFSGEPIFSVTRKYAIDKYSTAHVSGQGDRDRSGFLFAPRKLNKQDFTYWHVNYDAPAIMKFIREESVYGLPVYVYQATISSDQTANLSNLPEVGETRGVAVETVLTLWVEPQTGWLVSYMDASHAWYYDLDTKEKTEPWNSFSNAFTDEAVKDQVKVAKKLQSEHFFFEYALPHFILSISAMFLLLGLLQAFFKRPIMHVVPIAVFLFGLGITYISYFFVSQTMKDFSATRFDTDAQVIINQITKRIDIYASALRSASSFVSSSEYVSRAEWQKYVDELNLQQEYPGIQAFGYSVVLQPEEIVDFEKEVQKDGFPDFTLMPSGDRDVYTSIKYIEPFDKRNQRAFGFDMYQEPTRNKAMVSSSRYNQPAISGKVKLLQETEADVQAGFLMYVPVYKSLVEKSDGNDLRSYVYAAFRMNDFMNGALDYQSINMNVEIYDDNLNGLTTPISENLMFSTIDQSGEKDSTTHAKKKLKVINVYGREWTIVFFVIPTYGLDTVQIHIPDIIGISGLIFTILSTFFISNLISGRERAMILAQKMTKELTVNAQALAVSNTQLSNEIAERKKNQEELEKKTAELERINRLMVGREVDMKRLKEELKKQTLR